MPKFTVLLVAIILAVLVDVGRCRIAGGSFGQLRGAPQPGLGEGNSSGLKVFLDSISNGGHGAKSGDENDIDSSEYSDFDNDVSGGYEPRTQGPGGDVRELDSADEHTDHVNMVFDKDASHIAPDKYITGGTATGIEQYPWVVYLEMSYLSGTQYVTSVCGGSLVSWRHVITAAHCVNHEFKSYENVSIYLGEYNTRTFPTDCDGSRCVENVKMHPDNITIHQQYQRHPAPINDIAMLRLAQSVPNNSFIHPIALPTFNMNDNRYEDKPLMVTGWGLTEYGRLSPIKLHTQVHLVAPNTCKKHSPVTNGTLCTSGRNGQNRCSGDSGGPLMAEYEGMFHLVGLVSYRISTDCQSSVPSMYTNVYSYLEWIGIAVEY